MKCVVVGLGHVGSVIAADLLRHGHSVLGIEKNAVICSRFASGGVPFKEEGIAILIAEGFAGKRFSVAESLGDVSDVATIFVCVSTRGAESGALDTGDIVTAAREIGLSLRESRRASPVHLIFCSTFTPGTMDGIVLPELERSSGTSPGHSWEASYWPETSREGTALADRIDPSRIVIGERAPGTATFIREWLRDGQVPVFYTTFETAELVKITDNAFHALKVSFANELGRLCSASGLRAAELMEIICADRKLNISDAYLKPGFAYGGPCLPKDVLALSAHMKSMGVESPIIGNIATSNESHLRFALERVCHGLKAGARILLFGLSFKSKTDDVRGSPFVRLAQDLISRGYDLTIFDADLNLASPAMADPMISDLTSRLVVEIDAEQSWDKVIVAKHRSRVPSELDRFPMFDLGRM